MKTLEKDNEIIQKISDQLKNEVLLPAEQEACRIVEESRKKASLIVEEAEKQAEKLLLANKQTIEQERNVFQSSLYQAAKQSLDALRQEIDHTLFNQQIDALLQEETKNPKVIADLISAIVKSIEKEGLSKDLSAIIPKAVSVKAVNDLLAENILKKLQNTSVEIGDFNGGVKLKLMDKKMTLDLSEETLKDLLSRYLRKDFRQYLFGKVV